MKKDKLILTLIIVFSLIGLVIWGFLFWLVWQKQKPTEIKESEEKIFTADDIGILRRSLSLSRSRVQLIDNEFLKKEMSFKFIEQIEASARQSGVFLKINNAQDEPEVLVNFTSEGTFGGLMQFQFLLENLPGKIFFRKISVYKKVSDGLVENWLMEGSVKLISVN